MRGEHHYSSAARFEKGFPPSMMQVLGFRSHHRALVRVLGNVIDGGAPVIQNAVVVVLSRERHLLHD